MISRLVIKNVASYDATGVDVDTNKKINFFFGYNGSGKSTIAKYLHNITLPTTEQSSDFVDCSQIGYDPLAQTILVYDEEFKKENFILKDEQRGIFSLNKTNDIVDKQIDTLNDEIKKIQKLKAGTKEREERINKLHDTKLKSLEEIVFSKRNQFSTCRNATLPYGGSKKSFLIHIRPFLLQTNSVKTLPELIQEYNRVYANGLKYISNNIDIDAFNVLISEEPDIAVLLGEVIVGNEDVDIAKLIDQLQMSTWVESGMPYMEQSGDVCPFCQQPFTDKNALKHKLEQFFDKTYKEKMDGLREKAKVYYTGVQSQLAVLDDIVKVFNPDNKVSSVIGEMTAIRDSFVQAINEKKSKPNEKKSIPSLSGLLARMQEIKMLIESNNRDFENLSTLQNQWICDVQKYIAEDSRTDIERFDKWNEKYDTVLSANAFTQLSLQNQETYLRHQTDELRKKTVNTTDAVNNIKKILKNVGFDGFEIKEKKDDTLSAPTYYLKRNVSSSSNVYKSLSEGEKTFISFLYFYQLCLGTDDIEHGASKKKIIVIDDPVSSLDSKVMFVITSLIHQLARYKGSENKPERQEFLNPNIEQLFIFTHNFYFYKEVSFNRRPINTNQYHHIIEKCNSFSKISYTGENCTIKNDYSMMWENLKKAKDTMGTDKSQNVMLANTMRRVIDSYLDFVGIKKTGTTITWAAIDTFEEGSPEYIVESAFISLVNDESHGTAAMDDMYYDSIVKQEPVVIFNAFKSLFKKIGRSHYEYMMDDKFDD
jgi:wobble nucleotide-excising tRNase